MAKMLYIADLASGATAISVDRCRWDQGERKLPSIYVDGAWVRVTRIVERKSAPSNHQCDDRCLNATGRTMKCECSCGGKNHGKGRITCEAA